MTRKAIVIGEAFVDLIAQNDGRGGQAYWPRYGGSPLNVAVGMSRMGVDVSIATSTAPDTFGRAVARFFHSEGVDVATLSTNVPKTVLSIATPVDGHVSYEYFGNLDSMMHIDPIDPARLAEASVIHASSTAFNGDPVFSTVMAAYRGSSGFRTMDANPRPTLIDDVDIYRNRLETVYPHVDLIKFSGDDVLYLYPGADIAESARAIHEAHSVPVIVTRAADPTLLVFAGASYEIDVPQVDVVDATGAGDSFMASVLADIWHDGRPLSAQEWIGAIERGNVAARITCSAVGGAESMPTRVQRDANHSLAT
jgi:fructokinase